MRSFGQVAKQYSAGRLTRRLRTFAGDPVIVIGMHRSGTSMVARLLRAAGGYLGANLEQNSEPRIFIALNDAFLRCRGGTWFSPPAREDNAGAGQPCIARSLLRNAILLWSEFYEPFGTPGVERDGLGYLELKGGPVSVVDLLRACTFPAAPTRPVAFWGWKDPRSALTLDIWLGIFPDARVVHVIRNGIDSALSLSRRCAESGVGAPDCLDPDHCFRLWERYVGAGMKWRALGARRYHEVRYEDFLAEPVRHARELLNFLGQPPDMAADHVDAVRIRSVRRVDGDERTDFARRAGKSRLLVELGYEASRVRSGSDQPRTPAKSPSHSMDDSRAGE